MDSRGNKKYKFVRGLKNGYAVIYFNEYEWIKRIEHYKKNGTKSFTYIRPMKLAVIKEYDKQGKLVKVSVY